jgi:hypothetical protein
MELDDCVVADVTEPVKFLDIYSSPAAEGEPGLRTPQLNRFSELQDLTDFLDKPDSDDYTCRYMCVGHVPFTAPKANPISDQYVSACRGGLCK